MCKPLTPPRTAKGPAGAPKIAKGKGVPLETHKSDAKLHPFVVHLDLRELVDLNEVLEHARSGIIAKGSVFNSDSKRPERILALVKKHFALVTGMRIEIGAGAGSDRFLVARFAWGVEADVGGVSAQGLSRSKTGSFNKMGKDQGSPVTAYVFEGVVGKWIVDYLGAVKVNADNLFAWTCSHELGHNLGLRHHASPGNIMYTISGKNASLIRSFLTSVSGSGASFNSDQIRMMKSLLARP